MASHFVKCLYCSQTFDANTEEYIKIGRRYAHKRCAEEHETNISQEDRDLEELEKFILKLFNIPYLNAKIKRQIKNYHDDNNYSYSGMLKTLNYWFNIKKNSIEQANGGIGIIPWVYTEASQYYYFLYLAQLANKDKNIENYKPKTKTITIPPPEIQKKKHKLFFEGD